MTKNQEKKLDKATDKIVKKPNKDSVPMSIKIVSIIFLLIMVLSLVSFGLLYAPNNSSNVNEQGVPENLAFQEIQQQGQTYRVAVKNHEVFIFDQGASTYESIDGAQSIAQQLQNQSQVQIYQTNNFNNSNALYELEKYLSAAQIQHSRINQTQCTSSTIYLKSDTDPQPQGSCMSISAEQGEQLIQVRAVLYHLLK